MVTRSRAVRRFLLLALLIVPPAGLAALSRPLSTGLPWEDRLGRDGIELQVAVDPADALRERKRVAFTFRIADEFGNPMSGLRPTAWLQPLEAGKSVDPLACIQEMETDAGWRLVKAPALLNLDLREGQQTGTYEAVARMGRPGRYEVAFFLGSPRLVHCFEIEVRPAGILHRGP